jgi:hypothetical protein
MDEVEGTQTPSLPRLSFHSPNSPFMTASLFSHWSSVQAAAAFLHVLKGGVQHRDHLIERQVRLDRDPGAEIQHFAPQDLREHRRRRGHQGGDLLAGFGDRIGTVAPIVLVDCLEHALEDRLFGRDGFDEEFSVGHDLGPHPGKHVAWSRKIVS